MIDYKDKKFQSWLRETHHFCGLDTWKQGFASESLITSLFSKHMNTLWNMYQKREIPSFAAEIFLGKYYPANWVRVHSQQHIEERITRHATGKEPIRAARVPRKFEGFTVSDPKLLGLSVGEKKKQSCGKVIRFSDRNKK